MWWMNRTLARLPQVHCQTLFHWIPTRRVLLKSNLQGCGGGFRLSGFEVLGYVREPVRGVGKSPEDNGGLP